MKVKVHIKNIGKIKNGSISVYPITVLAGPNNTGKSFFSKVFYSFLNTMNSNLMLINIQSYLKPLKESIKFFMYIHSESTMRKRVSKESDDKKATYLSIRSHINHLELLFKKYFAHQKLDDPTFLNKQMKDNPKIKQGLDNVILDEENILSLLDQIKEGYFDIFRYDKKSILREQVTNSIKSLKTLLNVTPIEFLNKGFSMALNRSIIGNFQISQLHKLIRSNGESAHIRIERKSNASLTEEESPDVIGQCNITKNGITSDLMTSWLLEAQYKPRVVYLESPMHWKLRNALIRFTNRIDTHRTSLLVPKYWSDLNSMLIEEWSGEIAFPKIFQDLTENILKGKMIMDESGSLQFKFKDDYTAYSLPMTATGVVQLGVLALLIEKKVLDKGSVLFIDEPETNLHPDWQVKMMQTLFELAKEGVYIVIATHSVDMMKWLESHIKNNPDDKNLVAVNQTFIDEKDGSVSVRNSSSESLEAQIKSVQENLTAPFLKLFLKE